MMDVEKEPVEMVTKDMSTKKTKRNFVDQNTEIRQTSMKNGSKIYLHWN